MNGATYNASVETSGGGVGRNIAEAIWKIYGDVKLISAVGNDQNGDYIKRLLPNHCESSIVTTGSHPTGNFSVLLDCHGDCKLCVGDMSIHQAISPEWIESNRQLIQEAPLVIIDTNLSESAIARTLELCVQLGKPVPDVWDQTMGPSSSRRAFPQLLPVGHQVFIGRCSVPQDRCGQLARILLLLLRIAEEFGIIRVSAAMAIAAFLHT
ncbi:pseudouridine kinase-like [Uranotaenia lowii]|uniref:pseudouridine kinase-like n=1 Tax=Uranotaenia lowii TaxID=190385 RepID=UPI002478945A|nr:pseudouridine kinase-like [Uranotaenia lowii]